VETRESARTPCEKPFTRTQTSVRDAQDKWNWISRSAFQIQISMERTEITTAGKTKRIDSQSLSSTGTRRYTKQGVPDNENCGGARARHEQRG